MLIYFICVLLPVAPALMKLIFLLLYTFNCYFSFLNYGLLIFCTKASLNRKLMELSDRR